ncbi:MAG: ABC transporter permease [Terriglobales bacterium]
MHLRMAAADGKTAVQAAREFGNYDLVTETTREQWGWRWLASIGRDLRLAFRDLRHHRGYAAVAIITFGLAMGAYAAIYGMADAIYFHPMPYVPQENRLTTVEVTGPGRPYLAASPAEFQDLQAAAQRPGSALAAAGAFTTENMVWNNGAPMQVDAAEVSPGLFSKVLKVAPRWGHRSTSTDFLLGGRAVMVSYGFWKAHLGGEAGALGRVLHLNGQSYIVTGILGRQFDFLGNVDVWLPLQYTPLEWGTTWRQVQNQPAVSAGATELEAVARLRPGVSWARANAWMAALAPQLPEDGEAAPRLRAVPENVFINGNLTPVLVHALLGAMAFLLLLACANVANLNLARASSRQHEMALRAALGARGARLVQMMLSESLVLAFLGGAVGVALAKLMLHLLGHGAPSGFSAQVTGYSRIGVNYHVLLVAFMVCAAAGILSGLAPAWRVLRRGGGLDALHAARANSGGEGGRTQQVLVGVQTARR